jgi:hypothetical protein
MIWDTWEVAVALHDAKKTHKSTAKQVVLHRWIDL